MSIDDQVCRVISTATPTVFPEHSALSLCDMQVMLILLLSCSMLVAIVVRQPQILPMSGADAVFQLKLHHLV